MFKKKLFLTMFLFLAAFVFAGTAMAAPSVSWLTPSDNSHYAVGTAVTLNGQAAGQGQVGGTGLDIVLVMDASGSMSGTRATQQKDAAKALVAALPQDATSVGIVSFTTGAVTRIGLTQLDGTNTTVNAAIDSVPASGGTAIHAGIDQATPLLTGSANQDRLQAMVVMSDGGSNLTSAQTAADNAVSSRVEAIHSILMGSSQSGENTLKAVVNGADNIYGNEDDYGIFTPVTDFDDLLDFFSGTGGNLVGLSKIDITTPDGTKNENWSLDDGFGNFSVDWTLGLGPNVFRVDAYGTDQTSATAYLTLYGDALGTPGTDPIPEPTTMALFGLGLLGLAGISRRQR